MPVQQVMPVVCSNCGRQYTAPVHNIVDGQDAAMKAALLQGQLNLSQCQNCGAVNAAGVPIYYYDLEKELAFVFAPSDLTVAGPAQEKMIGDLTNSVVNSLPQEQRKYYLFNPKQFLTLESMAKAILEADGITEEMLENQAAKVNLIQEFMQAPDEAALKEKVKAHDAELDYEFFEILTAYLQHAQMAGDEAQAQAFYALRSVLGRWSSQGKKAIAEIDEKLGLVILEDQEQLLTKLQEAKDDRELAGLISAGHALLDYTFFQKLTAKIDEATKSGDSETAATLKDLRTKVLDMKAQQEEASRAALEKAGNLLKEILQSSRPDKVIDEKLDELDEAFFFILSANIQEAQRQGHDDTARALELIGNMAAAKLQGQSPAAQQGGGESDAAQPQAEEAPEKPQIHISRR